MCWGLLCIFIAPKGPVRTQPGCLFVPKGRVECVPLLDFVRVCRSAAPGMQVCPPADCRDFGCPGHEFAVKGVRGCGIDTAAAAAGTTFLLEFLVADRGVPALVANVTRTIRVVPRCPSGLNYCAVDKTCSVVRPRGCSLRRAQRSRATAQPVRPLSSDSIDVHVYFAM